MKNNNKDVSQGKLSAFLPIGVFLFIYIGAGMIFKDFYRMPAITAFLIALFIAFVQNRNISFQEKLHIAAKGLADENIITMCLIFLTAGAFSGVVKASGGVTSTVNLGLSIMPGSMAVVGLFIICCFISLSMGTSVGTISALAPIAVGISEKTGLSMALCLGAVVSGAMFGDNLSMISDTTIAATKTQGCEMKDKFKTNFFVVLPAAIMTIIVLFINTKGNTYQITDSLEYNFILVVPYLLVLVGALIGFNVFAVLISGTLMSLLAGVLTGNISGIEIFTSMGDGIAAMYDITVISIIVSCISALINYNGGISYLLKIAKKRIRTKTGAKFGIAGLSCAIDVATANNTIAIVMAAPVADAISKEYDIEPRISASLLDIFSSVIQGLLPYGAQLLYASAATAQSSVNLSSIEIMPYTVYPIFMAICAVIWILLGRMSFLNSILSKFSRNRI